MDDSKNEILNEFLIESFDNLSTIAEEVTEYEKNPGDTELLNGIYRKVHTLKGSASFLKFEKLQKINHSSENILDLLRSNSIRISSDIIDILLESFDCCIDILKFIENNGRENDVDYSQVQNKLLAVLEIAADPDGKLVGEGYKIHAEIFNTEEHLNKQPSPTEVVNKEVCAEPSLENNIVTTKEDKMMKTKIEETKSKPTSGEKSNPKNKTISDTVIRVNVKLLDKIMNVVGELVLNRNQILQYANNKASRELTLLSQQLNTITTELQTDIMTTRMQPVGSVLGKFERIVRDLARGQEKDIQLIISGKETELDKTLLDSIKDPMTHLVRNSVDHGIEALAIRKERGKPELGTIKVKAYHEGGQVTIEISDDGKGLDPEVILSKALEKGVVTSEQGAAMTDKQILNLIFKAGFSTAEKVTNISGRGVGMDVVKTNIEKIGGSVDISSKLGEGTTFKLKIPLTLAIVPALVVKSHEEIFAIPQINLVELIRLEDEEVNKIEEIHGSEFLRLRGELIPIFRINKSLELEKVNKLKLLNDEDEQESVKTRNADENTLNIVVVRAENKVYGLIVETILDTVEIVVKPLSKKLKDLFTFAGATIMGDGRVALIIDTLGFYNTADKGNTHKIEKAEDSVSSTDRVSTEEIEEILLCRLGDNRPYGIPLCLVNRLEEFKGSNVEWSGKQPLIRYGDIPMPLVNLEESLKLNGRSILENIGEDPDMLLPCVVVNIRGRYFGMVVTEIQDIATADGKVNAETVDREGLLGTIFVGERTITLTDVHSLIEMQNIGQKFLNIKEGNNISRGKLLLVDDSPLYRKLQSEILMEDGWEVTTANDGREGIRTLDNGGKFDVVLTDIEMPNLNGFELASSIRKSNKTFSDIPIVAISSKVKEKDKEKGLRAGFNKYIPKQNREEVLQAVNFYLVGT